MGKKNRSNDEFAVSSVLAKPVSQEEKEKTLKQRRTKQLKTFITAACIVVLAVGLTLFSVLVKPWQYLPKSSEGVLQSYVSSLNDRNFESLKKCLSPAMLEQTEARVTQLGSTDALFNAVFADSLKNQFGDDVRFEVEDMDKTKNKLEDGVYLGKNYNDEYGATELIIITCNVVTLGSSGSNSTPTYVTMLRINGAWYIDNMTE